jgi:hypothetical protein
MQRQRHPESLQDRTVRRQDRLDGEARQALPGELLTLARLQFAAPSRDAKEVEPHLSVLVVVGPRDPGIGFLHVDAEFFVQFARERCRQRFARFHLAAGELPPAGVYLAGWALRQQERTVGPFDDGRDHFDAGCARVHRRDLGARAFSIVRPA